MKRLSRIVTLLALAAPLAAGCASDGAEGPAGPPGKDGKDGQNGPAGNDGMNGADGKDGKDGAQGPEGPPGPGVKWLSFADVGFPATSAQRHSVRVATKANVNGTEVAVGYDVILRSNQDPSKTDKKCDLAGSPKSCFGALISAAGAVLKDDGGAPIVADSNDYSSLMQVGTSLYSLSAFESNPGAIYATTLHQDTTSGVLTATATKAVDMSTIDGIWNPCAGTVSPWSSHLASEEYPPDARVLEAPTSWAELKTALGGAFADYLLAARYYGVDTTDATGDGLPDADFSLFGAYYSAYFRGFPVEIKLDAAGTPTVAKHYAMGRVALELPYVLPDKKTAIMTDDGKNGGLYMFIADNAEDLSAGTLYAARFYQTSASGSPSLTADLDWINLGHATDAQIKALLHPATGARIKFADIWDWEAPVGNACPDAGFKPVRSTITDDASLHCLKLKPGMELAASRLETGRYANYLGATTETNKEEGITFDPDSRRLYVAYTDVSSSMGAQSGGDDHINAATNNCGGVFAFDIGPIFAANGSTVTEYAPLNFYPLLMGTPFAYPAGTTFAGNSCSISGIASPDNLSYLPGYNMLLIGEDTSRHQNDALWGYNLLTRRLTRIMTTPYGSETTSVYWFPKVGNFAYAMAVVQHPYGESDQTKISEPESTGPESYLGVIGPLPALQ